MSEFTIVITLPTFDTLGNRIIILASDSQETYVKKYVSGKVLEQRPYRVVRKLFFIKLENIVLGIAFTGDIPQKIKFEDHVKSIVKNLKKNQRVNNVISQLKEYFESLELDKYERLNFKILFTWIERQVAHITEIAYKNNQWEYFYRNKRNQSIGSDPDHYKKFLEITGLTPTILQITKSKNEEQAKAICEQFISYVSNHDDKCGMGIQMVCLLQNDFKWIKAPKALLI